MRRFLTAGASLLLLVLVLTATSEHQAEEQQDHHQSVTADRISTLETQVVPVQDFPATGPILAIGGGGEGIIGRLKGSQVVAIDISRPELEQAPPGPLKIVMDARDLQFLDGSFTTVTSFFTLMYLGDADLPRVFSEAARVLRPGGRFLIWDAVLDRNSDETFKQTEMVVVPLEIELPSSTVATGYTVSTGYGVRWPEQARDLDAYRKLATDTGFTVVSSQVSGQWFFLELQQPELPAPPGSPPPA